MTYAGAMTALNVPMPPALERWIETRLAEGRYTSADDYVRDLVRRDQENAGDATRWLRTMIDEGLASGIVDEEPESVLDSIMTEDSDFRD